MTMNASMRVVRSTDACAGGEVPGSRGECLRVICAEYDEMPCLSLTRRQFARLWNLAPREAEVLLAKLVAARFLRCNENGRYIRVHPSKS